jgi:hypothetical protein
MRPYKMFNGFWGSTHDLLAISGFIAVNWVLFKIIMKCRNRNKPGKVKSLGEL